jgi:NAD+ kinase
MLKATTMRQSVAYATHIALNDVVVTKTARSRLIDLSVSIGDEFVTRVKADGLIIATPTGSTAYNLSAGGPILAPTLRAMVVTPVAPHFSLDRSLVLADDQEVSVEIAPDRNGVLVIDGLEVGRLEPGAVITCRVASHSVRVVRNEPHTFGTILRFRLLADRQA